MKIENWLTPALRLEVKTFFEQKYQRELSFDEIEEISHNLVKLIEITTKD